MIKGLIIACVALLGYDMAMQHGAGTTMLLGMLSHFFTAFGDSFSDSIFSK